MTSTFLRIFLGCLAETVIFHVGIMATCYAMLSFLHFLQIWKSHSPSPAPSGLRQEFRYSLIPLSLLYSSLTKLFLLFLLSIWRPASSNTYSSNHRWILPRYPYILSLLQMFDDDRLDREWIVRNVLGGMSAGFGLKVILDIHPFLTTIIVLAGWAAKTAAASVVSSWVGGDESTGELWLAYSIP